MKIVVPGGSGHIGRVLVPALTHLGHEVVVLTRRPGEVPGGIAWDGRSLGAWAREVDGCQALINLAGRSVDCRYNRANLRAMLDSRVDSTRVLGEAVAAAARPPRVWLQASTATIYSHRHDAPNDEIEGRIGDKELDAPDYWRFSIDIAQAWERALAEAQTPRTRKVALRAAMVMATIPGGAFRHFLGLARIGFGARLGSGRQYMSWIHEHDFLRAVLFLLERDDLEGPVNLASPEPLPQAEFARTLRQAWGHSFGLPATEWMLELGAFVLRTDTELLLKSRRVVPGRLLRAGFTFQFPHWEDAARELVGRVRSTVPRQEKTPTCHACK